MHVHKFRKRAEFPDAANHPNGTRIYMCRCGMRLSSRQYKLWIRDGMNYLNHDISFDKRVRQ